MRFRRFFWRLESFGITSWLFFETGRILNRQDAKTLRNYGLRSQEVKKSSDPGPEGEPSG